jgi:outer membrane receptor protein involved in Fe transport
MSGEQLQEFLNSMQGDEIDRIEVITNPSSRHEAEGSGGIIDIRTRRGLQFGMNGTVTAGYRQGRMDNENAGVNLNWRREKFNVFGNYSINRNNSWERISQINILQTSDGEITLNQDALLKSTQARLRNTIRAGVDYFINPNNTFGIIVNAYHNAGGILGINGFTDITPTFNGVNYSTSDNTNSGGGDGIQVNMNYQSTFDNAGQQLNFDFDYARFYSNQLQQNTNRYYDINDMLIGSVEQFSNANPQTINIYSARIDYKQPLWENAQMETGARFGQTTTDNNLMREDFINNVWQPDLDISNRFVYTEQISAAYINLSQQLGKFSLQGGLRGEYTYSKGEQKTTGEVSEVTYFDLFPTFFVNYNASQRHILGLSYSRRLSRPSFRDLNPFEITIDAYSFLRGNPNLKPAYTHNLQLSHTFAQSLMTRIAYSHTTDLIILTPIVDDATQRTGLIRSNFGRSQNISAMMNYRRQVVRIWTANLTVQGAYVINTSDESSGEFVNKGAMFVAQFNNNIIITPTLSAEVTGSYQSMARMGYFVLQPMGNFSIGLRQMLLNNKMTLSLTINDILYTSREKGYARHDNVNYSLYARQDSRHANLTLRYNFGSATVRAARNRQTGIEDEATRAGGR